MLNDGGSGGERRMKARQRGARQGVGSKATWGCTTMSKKWGNKKGTEVGKERGRTWDRWGREGLRTRDGATVRQIKQLASALVWVEWVQREGGGRGSRKA